MNRTLSVGPQDIIHTYRHAHDWVLTMQVLY